MNKLYTATMTNITDKPSLPCPLALSLSLLGDKWSLLIMRDVIQQKHRYGDFANSHEGIPSNILADRLKRLTQHGLIEKRLYQERPPRHEYFLTDLGCELLPSIQALAAWGEKNYECSPPPKWFYKLDISRLKEMQKKGM